MKRRTVVFRAVVVVVVFLVLGLGSIFISNILATTSPHTVCTINIEGELAFRVLNSTDGKPMSGVPVDVRYLYPDCPPNPRSTADIGVMKTDANGTIVTGGLGEFFLHVDYLKGYDVNASVTMEGVTTCVTLAIPSGLVHTTYLQPFYSNC